MGAVYFFSFSSLPRWVAQEFWDWECIPWDPFCGGRDRPEKTIDDIFSPLQLRTTYL